MVIPFNDNCFRVAGIQPLAAKENNASPKVDDDKDGETTSTQLMAKDEERDLTSRMDKLAMGSPSSRLLTSPLTDPLMRTPPVFHQLDLSTGSPCWSPSALSTSSLDSSGVTFTPTVSVFTLCISPLIAFLTKLIVPGSRTACHAGGAPPSPAGLRPSLGRPPSRGRGAR